jgi:ribosome-associated toxin RatA of RatAB toxin-antitoxin module
LLCAGLAHAAEPALSQQEVARLERGEVVTRFWKLPGTNIGAGLAVGLVQARPEQVFRVIADVARYKEYMQRVVESRIARREGPRYWFYYRIDMPWPLPDQWFVTKNVHVVDARRRVFRRNWTLDTGTFARNDGYWLVGPWRGDAARVVYSTVLQPKGAIPQLVINHATSKALPRAITTLRARVAELRRRGEL